MNTTTNHPMTISETLTCEFPEDKTGQILDAFDEGKILRIRFSGRSTGEFVRGMKAELRREYEKGDLLDLCTFIELRADDDRVPMDWSVTVTDTDATILIYFK